MKKYIYLFLLVITISSCSDIIEVSDISSNTVELLAPADNVTLNTTSLTLSWESVEDAESYQIQVARPDFENAVEVILNSTITQNSISVELEATNSYEWRVRAINSGYETPYTTYSFTIE
ncbi:fibronectin type III domain-containing protein [Kordia sp.]|uniref:fibronectin type III domain-containing protein n=1 Tax=Kordia sp. TaxID=1965332 RepID=UPI003D2CACA6